ncbi:MAG: bifunctional folylpolyglutamate synthase/dihydrofolate synthase [Myxococcales bacterium]|nr:MAG: bifunctional folylpolyglutamate synthase/dihydrofolate synthase [Myxococcales bacterium]
MTTSYREAARWLYSLQRLGIKVGLGNTRRLMALFGRPERRFRSVHIAGTNGKGSTAAFLLAIAEAAGLKCGLTISPHLKEPTERIYAGGRDISKRDFARLAFAVRDAAAAYNAAHSADPLLPTFFEALIAMAFLYFAEQEVDLAVVETGLGGRLDSTNVVRPEVSVITSIGIEHTEYLGHTIRAIAREKAGIVKPGTPVVTAARQPEALEVIGRIAGKRRAPLVVIGRDADLVSERGRLAYRRGDSVLRRLDLALAGEHQIRNAACAVATAEILAERGFPIAARHIRTGLTRARWPGRLELFAGRPPWLVDCAHNPAGVRTLAEHLASAHGHRRILFVFAAMQDKDYRQELEILAPLAAAWIFTQPALDRAERPETLAAACPGNAPKHGRRRVADALRFAAQMEGKFDLVVVAGSIFLVGEAYDFVSRHRPKG